MGWPTDKEGLPEFENIGLMADPALAGDYADQFANSDYLQPEKRLMRAILLDALDCIKNAKAYDKRGKTAAGDAADWIFSGQEEDYIFSFVSVCENLGLDPAYIRRNVEKFRAKPH